MKARGFLKMQNSLIQFSGELAAIVERAGQSVVAVYGGGRFPSSGVHWQPGVLVTTEHSLRRDEDIKVGLPDGRAVPAELAGRDPGSDLAVLKFDAGSMPAIASGAAARTGDLVLAVGRHRDIGVCASLGIVSVIGPAWNTWRGARIDPFIRLDLNLYPGCSGAAIMNGNGETIGLATSLLSRIAPVAVPRATVDQVLGELLRRGYMARGYLGVGLQSVRLPEDFGEGGLIVLSVEKDSPAAQAGLVVGDILIALDGRPVRDTRDVQNVLSGGNIGKAVSASILRGGARSDVKLTVGEKGK
jgi:S1-C subfamily serine protease